MPERLPASIAPPPIRIEATTIRLRGLRIAAPIGVYAHERNRTQPLLIDMDIAIMPVADDRIGATFDYAFAAAIAGEIAARGHIELVETFARRLAEEVLAYDHVEQVRIAIAKPRALAQVADTVGVEIVARRG